MDPSVCVYKAGFIHSEKTGNVDLYFFAGWSHSFNAPCLGTCLTFRFRRLPVGPDRCLESQCRQVSHTLLVKAAIYCRRLAGRLRCDGAIPCNITAATPHKSLPCSEAKFSAPITDFCREYLPRRVAHSVATKTTCEAQKARIRFAPVLLIPKSSLNAKCIVAINASKVDIAGVSL